MGLALLSVALSMWTHRAAGCLPDKACKGGLTVTYGSLELECDQDVAKGTVTNAPSLRIVGNSQTQVRTWPVQQFLDSSSCTRSKHSKERCLLLSRFGLAVRGYRLVSGRTSVRYRFGSPFSSKRLWFVDTVL